MLTMRLPDSLSKELDQEARLCSTSRSEIARHALSVYLRFRRRQRRIEQLQRAAGQLAGDDSCALAEESLPLDNETLFARESPRSDEQYEKWWR